MLKRLKKKLMLSTNFTNANRILRNKAENTTAEARLADGGIPSPLRGIDFVLSPTVSHSRY
ncbi:MAG: hypothetical protein K9K67_08795 [Bacteriovoracaceae bacterium]|nr:hypothetical protein [Bacteriovoracaceae bacterium]